MTDLSQVLEEPGTVLLDTSSGADDSYLFSGPREVLEAQRPSEVPGILIAVDAALAAGFHVAGFLAYEAGYGFETNRFCDVAHTDFQEQLGYPVAWFGVFDEPTVFTPNEVSSALGEPLGSTVPLELEFSDQEGDYRSKVEDIKTLIRDGDVYQVNLTGRFKGRTSINPLALYSRMRSRQPVSYGAFVQLGDVQLLSASPERFIEWRDGHIQAQPMKGTAPRGKTHELDDLLAVWLRTDPKNQAENLMIVDLLRNDLSVVCVPGTVAVPNLYDIEQYASVLQMTSTVQGQLSASIEASQILTALFPCGSITGAPKIRAMRRILELESAPRGIYCGAIGHLSPGGSGAFNVAIRTLSYTQGELILGTGGGIVWDSDSADEHEEAVLKTRFLSDPPRADQTPIEIIETMKWDGEFGLLTEHLARLYKSAARLGYDVPSLAISDRLDELQRSFEKNEQCVVRLLLGPGGAFRTMVQRFVEPKKEPYRIGISRRLVHSDNPFLQIKTTFRGIFDFGRNEAAERGLDEIIFLNERGEITEGTITNIFLKLDGIWVTPPLSSGLLAGVGRGLELRSERAPKEQVVTRSDYLRADEIVLTNAVRGRVQALRDDDVSRT